MAALSINRYWGDEAKSTGKDDAATSLQSLLAKIEERRKRQNPPDLPQTKTTAEVKPIEIQSDEPPSKKQTTKSLTTKVTEQSVEAVVPTSGSKNDDFTIISSIEFKKNQKLKRNLPNWLKSPTVISVDLQNLTETIFDLPLLEPSLVELLKHNKITHFFPVQSKLIPWLLSYHKNNKKFWPRDVCVSAPTGSGKTLAFVLPIIQILKDRLECCVRALVVLPTKDLAFQVYQVFKQYISNSDLRIICLSNSALEKEKSQLTAFDELLGYRSLVDIVVTTPGRLVEHLKYTPGFSLSHLKFLVVDEADHVMDSVQNDWLSHLQKYIPPEGNHSGAPYLTLSKVASKPMKPQKLLFSATLSQDPENLSNLSLFQPYLFTSVVKSEEMDDETGTTEERKEFIGKFATPAELTEYYTVCPLPVKPLMLYHIIKQNQWNRILCFADSVSSVHKLTFLLKQLNSNENDTEPMNVVEISSKLKAKVHHDILEKFSAGGIDILVTTDALARGIDLQNVQYVVLYDTPKFPKNYIHRIGRTGRAGQKGTSLVLVTPEQTAEFTSVLNICGKKDVQDMPVPLDELKKYENVYKNSLDVLRMNIEKERENSSKPGRTKKKKPANTASNSKVKERA